MRHYEVLFFVHPDQSTQVPSMVERYKNTVTESGGTIHRYEDWGRRRLAYPVAKIHKAHYILLNIECGPEAVANLQHAFRFNDAILRYLITAIDEAITESSPMMKKPPERDDEDIKKPASEAPREKPPATEAVAPVAEASVASVDAGEVTEQQETAEEPVAETSPESTDPDKPTAQE